MQSRNFFTFGPQFNILTDSVFGAEPKGNSFPATAIYLITEDNNFLITENSNNLIIE